MGAVFWHRAEWPEGCAGMEGLNGATSIAKRLKSLEAWKAKKLGEKKSPLHAESENIHNRKESDTESTAKIHEGKAKRGINKSLGQNKHLPLLRDIITHDR